MTRTGRPSGKRRRNRRGMLTFEWILVTAFLAVGLVGGVYALRSTIVCHYRSLLNCICQVDVCDGSQCSSPGSSPCSTCGGSSSGSCGCTSP